MFIFSLPWSIRAYGLFTQTVIFSVGCNSRIRHRTKNRILLIFGAVSDAAVASDTENCVRVTFTLFSVLWAFVISGSSSLPIWSQFD
jgi:hypothetical protein